MKTATEIYAKHNWNGSYNMYKELHENGFHDLVYNFILNGESGFTTDELIRTLCIEGNKRSFNDYQGHYAGTHYEIRYMGKLVRNETRYSLF